MSMLSATERCFGSSQTIQELNQCLREAGERLRQVKTEMLQELDKRVPGSWEGRAAQAFKLYMEAQIDRIGNIADGAIRAADGLKVLQEGLQAALTEYRNAEREAALHQLAIEPFTFRVYPLVTKPDTPAEVARVQAMVNAALEKAEQARKDALRRLELWHETYMGIFHSMMSLPPFGPPGARRTPRIRRPRGGVPRPPGARTLREPPVGSTDGGPGRWTQVNRGERGMEWQERSTGVSRTREYEVNGVKFDSYENGKLVDAKNDVYGSILGGTPRGVEQSVGTRLADEATRQIRAAPNTPIEWRVQDQFSAGWIENALRDRGIPMGTGPGQVNVIHFTQ